MDNVRFPPGPETEHLKLYCLQASWPLLTSELQNDLRRSLRNREQKRLKKEENLGKRKHRIEQDVS